MKAVLGWVNRRRFTPPRLEGYQCPVFRFFCEPWFTNDLELKKRKNRKQYISKTEPKHNTLLTKQRQSALVHAERHFFQLSSVMAPPNVVGCLRLKLCLFILFYFKYITLIFVVLIGIFAVLSFISENHSI